jgi:hypothetical protein
MHRYVANHQWLTFWHWSGVTPYTSSYEFAGSCVFDKQLPGILSLRPALFSSLYLHIINDDEKNFVFDFASDITLIL